jgi:dTDP-4-amino-4,6-dideoxygalactose transaminase
MRGLEAVPGQIGFAPPVIDESDIEAVVRVLRSGWLSTGGECQAFEAELAEYTGAPHVVAVSSCTAALEIALGAQRFGPGSRVGVPTWTFAASATSVVRAGATPVLLDVERDTLNLSAAALSDVLDHPDGLDGLVVVHFAGVPVAREVLDLAAQAVVPVVEDAAHALGAEDHRGPISGVGTVGACFSFYASKNLTSAEGGALATHDPELAAYAQTQRFHGMSRDAWKRYGVGADAAYDVVAPGLKANLPDVLAALGRSQLARFDDLQARRRAIVERYRAALVGIEGLRVVPADLAPSSADHLLVVVLPEGADRAVVTATMGREHIGTSVHFRPLHTMTWFAEHAAIGPGGTPVADELAGRALSLPLHAGLSDADVDRVVTVLADALR